MVAPRFRRDASSRHSARVLATFWNDPAAKLLTVFEDVVPLAGRSLAFVKPRGELGEHTWYLGKLDHAPVFVTAVTQPPATGERYLAVADQLSQWEQDIAVAALALTRWHESAGFSPRDGSKTTVAHAGWARVDEHGAEHFPRTDPAVIVRIEHDDKILLGSNALWPEGRFSHLAGFVEAGESAEAAVHREVFEESGVRLGEIEYLRSQPWPFPRSLMLGFRAELAADQNPNELIPEPGEITQLRWFTREEIINPPLGITLPMSVSLAAWLIQDWLGEHR